MVYVLRFFWHKTLSIIYVLFTEMDHLWTFASEAETFELKDIVAALSEIQVGQHQPKLPTLHCGRKIPKLDSRKF